MSLVLEFVSCVVKNLVNVPEDVMDGWVQNPKALQDSLTNALCPPKKEPELLRLLKSVVVSGATKFVAKDRLRSCNVGWTGHNFKKLFLEKVEENVPEAKLAVSWLERNSFDVPILTELGDKAEVKLSYLFDLLAKQSNGEDGVLLTNGCANIFYVCGVDGNIWPVDAFWYSDVHSWFVEACSVELLDRWNGGFQIFFRYF